MNHIVDKKKCFRYGLVSGILLLLLAAAVVVNVNTGSVDISPLNIFKIIFFNDHVGSMESNIIWKIRLPRLLSAAVLGGALSVSGLLLQVFFRNPIAGPFVLGISSGAKMFVGFVMIIMLKYVTSVPMYVIVLAAFVGSMAATALVLLFAGKVNHMSMLLIIGIMIGYICTAVTDFFVTFANESNIANLTYWSMGSFSGTNWESLRMASIIVFITMAVTMLFCKPIGAYQLGEGYAKSMGINIKSFRIILITLSSVLSACVTAFVGPVSFVGIAVPHIAKMLVKTSKPLVVIPVTFLTGAVFCMYSDFIARTAFAPVELSIGTVTSMFGAPVVIWLMIKNGRKYAAGS